MTKLKVKKDHHTNVYVIQLNCQMAYANCSNYLYESSGKLSYSIVTNIEKEKRKKKKENREHKNSKVPERLSE